MDLLTYLLTCVIYTLTTGTVTKQLMMVNNYLIAIFLLYLNWSPTGTDIGNRVARGVYLWECK